MQQEHILEWHAGSCGVPHLKTRLSQFIYMWNVGSVEGIPAHQSWKVIQKKGPRQSSHWTHPIATTASHMEDRRNSAKDQTTARTDDLTNVQLMSASQRYGSTISRIILWINTLMLIIWNFHRWIFLKMRRSWSLVRSGEYGWRNWSCFITKHCKDLKF